jgi:cell division transport system ATP-binding protein
MLEFNTVSFSYPNQPVFENLNFILDDEKFCFLIGRSGSGKSTLLQMIYMDILPQSGIVSVDHFSSDNIRPKDLPLLRRKIGIIFQDFKLLSDRNVYDNLAFVLEVTGVKRKTIKKKVTNALNLVGLCNKVKNMPDELSGGEKQRIAIARAIINEPALILADEPTGNLDPETSEEIFSILKRIHERGATVICATHNYDLVRKYPSAGIIKLENKNAIKMALVSS